MDFPGERVYDLSTVRHASIIVCDRAKGSVCCFSWLFPINCKPPHSRENFLRRLPVNLSIADATEGRNKIKRGFQTSASYLFIPETVNTWIDKRFPPDRNSIVDKSEMPGKTLSSPSIVDKSEMHPWKIDNEQLRKIDNEVEQRIPKNTAKKTTTTSVERSAAVVASPSPVVVVSSLASGDEDPEEIADKLTEEFGLSMPQTRMVWEYLSNQGKGYVLEKANVVRSEPRENLAGSFVKALEKDWKPKKASGPPKRQKVQPAIQDPLKELSSEEKQAEVAQTEARLETTKARWILADADQRSTWLERMDTVSRKLAPVNGSEPRRGFLLCLAAILESPPEMKSTPSIERIDRRSCHCRLMLRGCGLLKGAFDAVVSQLCGQRPVAEIAELIADLLPNLSGSVNAYIR